MEKLLCLMLCLHGLLYAGECSGSPSEDSLLVVRRTALLREGTLKIESRIPADFRYACSIHQKSIETGYALRSWSDDENIGRSAGALALVAEGAQAMALCQRLADVYAEKLKSAHITNVDPIDFFIASVDILNETFVQESEPNCDKAITRAAGILVYNNELFVARNRTAGDDAHAFPCMQLRYRGSTATKVEKRCNPKISWEPNKK